MLTKLLLAESEICCSTGGRHRDGNRIRHPCGRAGFGEKIWKYERASRSLCITQAARVIRSKGRNDHLFRRRSKHIFRVLQLRLRLIQIQKNARERRLTRTQNVKVGLSRKSLAKAATADTHRSVTGGCMSSGKGQAASNDKNS